MKLDAMYVDASKGLFEDAAYVECVLTDEHAACSYGLPTLLVNGTPHGPGDLPAGTSLTVHTEKAPPADPALYESDAEMAARATPESLDLIGRARAAGYKVA